MFRCYFYSNLDFSISFKKKSLNVFCKGISGKSQILFALVFVTRYLDLFTHFISLYNTIMKIFYLSSSFGTIYLIYVKFKATYDRAHDTFRIEFLIVPAVILSLLLNHDYEIIEVD
jgi:ER lumen protein retaining receptor